MEGWGREEGEGGGGLRGSDGRANGEGRKGGGVKMGGVHGRVGGGRCTDDAPTGPGGAMEWGGETGGEAESAERRRGPCRRPGGGRDASAQWPAGAPQGPA